MTAWGIDISNHQAGANLAKAKAAGASFVFAKATEGLTYTDDHFAGFRAQAKTNALRFGAYHFARPQAGRTGAQEAAHFLAVAGTVHDLPPVLDLEDTKLSAAATYAFALDWLTTVAKATGVRPIVYTYTAFAQQHLGAAKNLVAYPLWLANYRSTPPPAPSPWSSWVAWQHTSSATVPGIPGNCDRNIAAAGFPPQSEEDDMPLTAADAKTVWDTDLTLKGTIGGAESNESPLDILTRVARNVEAVAALTKVQADQVAAAVVAAQVAAKQPTVDVDALARAIVVQLTKGA